MFWVTAVDYEGNMSKEQVEYVVDAEPPVVPTIIAPADGRYVHLGHSACA